MRTKKYYPSALSNIILKNSNTHDSFLISQCLRLSNTVLNKFQERLQSSFFTPFISYENFVTATIFLFIVSLALAPNSQIQLSSLSSERINMSQRQFGVVFFSLTNILLFPLIIIFFQQQKEKFFIWKHEIFLILFLLVSEISILQGFNITSSFVWLIKTFFGILLYFIFSRCYLTKKIMVSIIFAILLTIFLEGIIGILQYAKGGLLGIPLESSGRISSSLNSVFDPIQYQFSRSVGTLSHPNNLSNYLALLLPISIVLTFSTITNIWLARIAIILCITSSYVAFSRWGFATNIFSFLLTITLLRYYTKRSFIHLVSHLKIELILLLMITCLFFVNPFLQKRFFSFSSQDRSLLSRTELIIQSISMTKTSPLFGIGAGNFSPYFVNYDITPTNLSQRFLAPVHNMFFLFASEVGLIGLFFFISFIVSLGHTIFIKLKNINSDLQILGVGFFASFVTFIFNGQMTIRTFEDRVGFLFCVLTGILVNIVFTKKELNKMLYTKKRK